MGASFASGPRPGRHPTPTPDSRCQTPGARLLIRGTQSPPGSHIGTQQTIDETSESVSLIDDCIGDLYCARFKQREGCLDLLVFCVGSFEVLSTVSHRSAIGFGEPESCVVSSSHKVVTQVRQATLQ